MTFSLRPHQLVAHWVPGFVSVGLLALTEWKWAKGHIDQLAGALGGASVALVVIVCAFAIGQFLDSCRDLFEEAMCKYYRKCAIKWEFVWKMSDRGLRRMEDYYFTYYVFGFNMAGALLVTAIAVETLPTFSGQRLSWLVLGVVLLAAAVFALDSYFLRKDIIDITDKLPVVNETA